MNGLKTGHTLVRRLRAGGHAHARVSVTLVSVVLGTPSLAARDQDSLALLRWGEGKFERIHPVTLGTVVGTAEIQYRRGATVNLVTEGSVTRVVRRGAKITVNDVGVPDVVTGPGRARAAVRLSRGVRGRQADRRGADRRRRPSCPAPTCRQRTKDWFTRPSALLLAVAVLGGTVLVGRRLRRGPPRRRPPRSEPEAA